MKLNVDSSGIDKALRSIGGKKASLGELRSARVIDNPIETRIRREGEVVLTGAELGEQLITPGGLLAIGTTQVTLHIYDPFVDEMRLNEVPADQPKFHMTECRTIEDMRNRGRFNRYVTSARTDGLFSVRPFDQISQVRGEKMEAVLGPCKNCLKSLDYDGWASATSGQKNQILSAFTIERFFEDFEPIFRCLPIYTSDTFPAGDYPEDWAKISRAMRKKSGWICSCCQVDCSDNTGLLHAHHKDGNRGNVRPSNIEVICVACHKARPFHGHMHVSAAAINRLEQLRLSQKLSRLCKVCNL